MTSTQFQAFMQQLDASLAEIGHEISEDEHSEENSRLFMQSIIRRMRQGFMEISKQVADIAVANPASRQGAIEAGAPTISGPDSLPSARVRDYFVSSVSETVDLYYQNQEWLKEWS